MFVKVYPDRSPDPDHPRLSLITEEQLTDYATQHHAKCKVATDEHGSHYVLGYVRQSLPKWMQPVTSRIVIDDVIDYLDAVADGITEGYYEKGTADATYDNGFLRVEGRKMYSVYRLYKQIRSGDGISALKESWL